MTERTKEDVIDKVAWMCSNDSCYKYKTTKSKRVGSFFDMFRLSLANIWTVIVL